MAKAVSTLYPNLYLGQVNAIEEVLAAPEKCVVVIGPTGSGKSVVNFAIAEQGLPAVILCVTKQLQQQYKSQFPGYSLDIKGKQNYFCEVGYQNAGVASEARACRGCEYMGECPYYVKAQQTYTAPIVVTNYAFYVRQKYYGKLFKNIRTVIMDEAHELEKTLLGTWDFKLEPKHQRWFTEEFPYSPDPERWHNWAAGVQVVEQEDQDEETYKEMKGRLEAVKAALTDDNWVIDQLDTRKFEFKPVWVTPSWSYPLHSSANRVILSSASVDPEFAANMLGFKDFRVVEIPSTFEAWRRPILFRPVVKVQRNMSEDAKTQLVGAIDLILGKHHPNEKGLVHTVSYHLRDEILKRSIFRDRFMWHSSTNRELVLAEFKESLGSKVLISPSMTTGVDLPGDLLRFQIIAKLPIPYLGDPRVAQRRRENKAIENAEISSTLIQMYGRGMRTASDFCISYILDRWAYYFYQSQVKRGKFPKYFVEAVGELGPL